MRMQGIISRASSLTSTCEKMSKKSTVTWPARRTRKTSNLSLTQLQILSSKKTSRTAGSSNFHHFPRVPSTNRLGIWAILGRKCPVMTPYDGERIRAPLEVRYACLDGLSHSFQNRVAREFKEPEARSQKTQAPGLVLQLTTQCKHFISQASSPSPVKWSEPLYYFTGLLMITNVTAGKAQKCSVVRVTERNPM